MIESEKLLERKLGLTIKALGGWSIKMLSSQITGLPDRLCLLPGGRVFFAEIKTTGEKPKKIQLYVHKRIRSLGFRVEVIDSSAQIEKLCESL
jgi:hypothetical protein